MTALAAGEIYQALRRAETVRLLVFPANIRKLIVDISVIKCRDEKKLKELGMEVAPMRLNSSYDTEAGVLELSLIPKEFKSPALFTLLPPEKESDG